MVNAFLDMVRIGSESGEEKAFLEFLSDLFSRELQAQCSFDSFGNLFARVRAKNCSARYPILLSCHGDTVKPGKNIDPVLENGVIRSRGDTVLGGDDKAGIAELYEAILSAERHPEIEIAITREEEIGLVGARNLDFSMLKSKEGLCSMAIRPILSSWVAPRTWSSMSRLPAKPLMREWNRRRVSPPSGPQATPFRRSKKGGLMRKRLVTSA